MAEKKQGSTGTGGAKQASAGGSAGGKKGAGSTNVTAGAGAKGGAADTGGSAPKKRAAGAGKAESGAAAGTGGATAKKRAGGAGAKKQGGSDLRSDMRDFAAARPNGWDHHDWVTFLGGLREKGHDTGDADEIGRQLERERISLILQGVQGLGPRKVDAVADRFGRLYELRNASVDEIAGVPGVTRELAEKISNAVR